MEVGNRVRETASEYAQNTQEVGSEITRNDSSEEFQVDRQDFLSVRERGESAGTRIEQREATLGEAAEVIYRSFPERGEGGRIVNVISPVVLPNRQSLSWRLLPIGMLLAAVALGLVVTAGLAAVPGGALGLVVFGPHLWILLGALAVFVWWRQSVVMVPDGCQALVTRFGRLEETAGAGRKLLFNPWKQVSYIVNTAREYPFNAPVREAPTSGRVNASVDLFLQFRIEDPSEFIFTLGGVKGFSDKLQNAISEMTRALIYEQRAEEIYDLVGESTDKFLDSLNQQFLPAVRFTNANITHAEPTSQDYRIDLASPEMVRVAKEAYTYQYELSLKKEQNEGELNKELASLRETLSAIQAEISGYQAQIDTANERENNRANARARERMVEAESTANANAALLEAQALDIRAVSGAGAPEILEYRFQQHVLDRLEAVAGRLPQVVQLGDGDGEKSVDFQKIARGMIGSSQDGQLFTAEDLQAIRERMEEIQARIRERESEIESLTTAAEQGETEAEESQQEPGAEEAYAERVEEIRQSVTDEEIQREVEQLGQDTDSEQSSERQDDGGEE